jgi:predicted short-subunit dehydrogenase-like oxidoreductase (DUF2520 family)
VFRIGSILNRSVESATAGAAFIGAGRAVARFQDMETADVFMISTSDDAIEGCCRSLSGSGVLLKGDIVFHCSGSMPSTVLMPAKVAGARIAGIHPVKSFADPAMSVQTFPGTFCAVEGDPEACEALSKALERCGARIFGVTPEFKAVYHAATVFVCNYLIALMEVGLKCFEKAGLSRETATEVMQPIVRGTVDNLFRLGTVRALTGPIARGEETVVARQIEALGAWDPDIERLYKLLGRLAADLSEAQGNASPDSLQRIRELLGE